MSLRRLKSLGFFALVGFIILQAVFPFYYAMITSLKSGQALFEVTYLPTAADFSNYAAMLTSGVFGRQFLNSVITATSVVLLSLAFATTAA
ncbi:MAG: carbohydrate ABC transporter permease, partial [Pseudomonadota bacterium]